jgi:hypothetical protein
MVADELVIYQRAIQGRITLSAGNSFSTVYEITGFTQDFQECSDSRHAIAGIYFGPRAVREFSVQTAGNPLRKQELGNGAEFVNSRCAAVTRKRSGCFRSNGKWAFVSIVLSRFETSAADGEARAII